MPAYNFKKQFVSAVESGTKLCTIRGKAPTVGTTAYLYTGMRTKQCRKLGEGVITRVTPFSIAVENLYAIGDESDVIVVFGSTRMSQRELAALAKKDGFETVREFIKFFLDTYGAKFEGYLIEWGLKPCQ